MAEGTRPGGGRQRDGALWPDILRALRGEILSDHVMMVAAGLSFYAVLGLLPALAAAAALLGRIGGFGALHQSLRSGHGMLPDRAVQLLDQFVTSVPEGFGGGPGLAINLGLVVVIAYRGAGGLLTALNIVYDVSERRGWLRRGLVALLVGLCGIAFLFAALALLALPPLLAGRMRAPLAAWIVWLRWPALALVFLLGLVLLFRYAPSRDRLPAHWLNWGAVTAAVLWIAASVGVSFYADNIAALGRFYGSLGSVAVVLLWFYVSALAILAGAEIDAIRTARAEGRGRSRTVSALRRHERAAE